MVVTPERSIAEYAMTHQRYRFLINTPAIGVSYEKKWRSQVETSIRLLFPFFGGRLVTALLGLFMLTTALLPFVVVLVGVVIGAWSILHMLALVAATLLLFDYIIYTARVWRGGWLIGGLLLPVIIVQECCLLIQSMYAYATGTVTWKGRQLQQSARRVAEG